MDPQKQALIDAKRKEIYDRVMGMSASTNTTTPAVLPIQQEPVFSPVTSPAPNIQTIPTSTTPQPNPIFESTDIASNPLTQPIPPEPIIPPPPASSPQPYFQPDPIPEPSIVPNNVNAVPTQSENTQSRKLNLRWILVLFLIAGFLLGYAIFWIKVFGVKLPILSNFF